MTRLARAYALAVALLLVVGAATACGDSFGTDEFEPNVPGVLTVATELPARPFWDGADPNAIRGGYEDGIARKLARQFDLKLRVVDRPFDAIVNGRIGNADLALAQVTITSSRAEDVDFSVPYFRSDFGILTRDAIDIPDLKTARDQTWVAQRGTTQAQFIDEVIQPEGDVLLVETVDDAVAAVRNRRADAALLDTVTALTHVSGAGGLHVPAQFAVNEQWGAVMKNGSNNRIAIDKALRRLNANGTLDDLQRKWIDPVTGQNPESVPYLQAKELRK